MQEQGTTIDSQDEKIKNYVGLIINESPRKSFSDNQIEQIVFRVYLCNKCLVNKKCNTCKCNPLDVLSEPYSCNHEKVFPHFMSKEKWDIFKKENKIIIK